MESDILCISTSMTIVLVLLIPIIICWCYCKRKRKMSILKRNGINGPQPNMFTGNLAEYNSMENVHWDTYLVNTFGLISGYYLGAKPIVLVADTELIRKIQVSDVDKFLERPRRVPGGINPDPHRSLMLGNLPVPEWKQVRRILAPSFNKLNIKEMTSTISILVDKLISNINEHEEMDFYAKFQTLTLDVIGKTAFGIDSNIQENPNDPLMAAVAAEFTKTTNSRVVKIYLCFPELSFILHPLRLQYHRFITWMGWTESSALWQQGRVALAQRIESGTSHPDLLQKLLLSDLSQDQIVANSVLFFEAAYETMSSALGFTVHLLVRHQDVQNRVREELQDHILENKSFDFSILSNLPYLDQVINESLRLFPPQTTFIGRAPIEDYHYVNAKGEEVCVIPKGTHIQVALFQIHHSPQGWINPEVFDPDRFYDLQINKNDWFQPFGRGKRVCIGKDFANFVLKLMLAKLFFKFILVPSAKTEKNGNVSIHFKTATMTPRNGSWGMATPTAA